MKEWICNKTHGGWRFTKGKVYSTNKLGCLIDDDGVIRLKPETYNFNHVASFIEVIKPDLLNV